MIQLFVIGIQQKNSKNKTFVINEFELTDTIHSLKTITYLKPGPMLALLSITWCLPKITSAAAKKNMALPRLKICSTPAMP